jgi:sarcosine oxidase
VGRDADIVVIGAGITGVATARALAQAGRGVIVVEQFEPGHDRGSSHGGSRIFRLSYDDPHYVRLAQGALQSWRELEAECGEQLIVPTGGLDFGPIAAENARALASCGVRHELLSGAEVAERWPIAGAATEQALFQPDGGTTLADRAYSALLDAAVDAGAVVVDRCRVTAIEPGRGSVRVSTDGDEIIANACVVAAGAWAAGLLSGISIELPVVPTRETVAYFRLPGALALPPVIDDAVPDAEEHGLRRPGLINFALAEPGVGLKAGLHHAGPPADPDETGAPDPAIIRWVSKWVARRYPGIDPEPIRTQTCLYTSTADESFVLERHGRIVVASACSGHGFKFAPAFGRTIAALARDAAA